MKKVALSFVCLLGLVVMFGKSNLPNEQKSIGEAKYMMLSEPGGS